MNSSNAQQVIHDSFQVLDGRAYRISKIIVILKEMWIGNGKHSIFYCYLVDKPPVAPNIVI